MSNWQEYVVMDPEVLAGKPVVKGTRLGVSFVLGLLAEGWTEQQVLDNYPTMSRDALRAIYAFAAETLGDETFYPAGRKTG